jgi:putative heme-binding domain-containing protein
MTPRDRILGRHGGCRTGWLSPLLSRATLLPLPTRPPLVTRKSSATLLPLAELSPLAAFMLLAILGTFSNRATAQEAPGGDTRPAAEPVQQSQGPQQLQDQQQLSQQLLDEGIETLARAAQQSGDATRGAILFHQSYMTCTQCHAAGEEGKPLGPDLARFERPPTPQHLAESLLQPSRQIREGYQTLIVETADGRIITGLPLLRDAQTIVLRDAAQHGKALTIPTDAIETEVDSPQSIMPEGLTNQLTSRQQFLDLLRYLIEISQGGPSRAEELKPAAALLASRPLPEYEQHLDHAGLIAEWGPKSLKRGKAIYNRLCVNCHGTHDRAGSLPTSLRFAEGTFKNGSDPYRMYQTLTRGFGMMVAQGWMVPRQKYDVIHYIREAYLRQHNPAQLVEVNADYLANLPAGDTPGPEPSRVEPWVNMNYGPTLIGTYEVGGPTGNFAYKGIAVRLDAGPGGITRGHHWALFDHDTLRMAGAWSGDGFIDFESILFTGRHAVHPRTVGAVQLHNPVGPGWANPADGSFEDPRLRGRDGKPYGPLPRDWAHYRGLYLNGQRAIVSYTVGRAGVLEMPGVVQHDLVPGNHPAPILTRSFQIGARDRDMILQVARAASGPYDLRPLVADASTAGAVMLFGPRVNGDDENSAGKPQPDADANRGDAHETDAQLAAAPESRDCLLVGIAPPLEHAQWTSTDAGDLRLTIPAGDDTLRFMLWTSHVAQPAEASALVGGLKLPPRDVDLEALLNGGPPRWPEKLQTQVIAGKDDGPFAVDVLVDPKLNPWLCRMRPTGFDFFSEGDRAAVCCWDGDVWLVTGLRNPTGQLTWQRIASGLFQPLGLKIVDGRIFVTCRDQLAVLHDLNDDGEIDFYENFNNDHQVTEHFHEFAMGLQTDAQGNFYYAKSARHAKKPLVPHHGTLLRIAADGSRTDILATGFRAANGVCVNPDGSFIVTDQEGHWNPKNRINWVTPGGFYGNMWGYHDITDTSDSAMQQPLCWITNEFDRSPAELLWVDSDAWGPLKGSLLNLSYGYGKIFVVPHERVGGQTRGTPMQRIQMQGGMCELPLPQFPTGLVRGRFSPADGALYACGMYAWASNQQQPGGFYRVRYTGRPVHLPIGLRALPRGIAITFSGPLDPDTATDPKNYAVKSWALKRTANYGSDHYDEHSLEVASVELADDGRTARLHMPDIQPTWCMEIRYTLHTTGGKPFRGTIHNTIHALGE